MICSGNFAWPRWSAWDDVSNVNARYTCACGTRVDGSTDRVGCSSHSDPQIIQIHGSSGLMAVNSLSASEQDTGVARSELATADGPAAPVHSYGVVMLLSDDVTPFWTVTDNPTPFRGLRRITPSDTDWLSVFMCSERTGPS